MSEVNHAFVARLNGAPQDVESDVPQIREYFHVTKRLGNAIWCPKGPKSRHPQGSNSLSYAIACRLALIKNLDRMSKQRKGVHLWTVVCSASKYYTLDVEVPEQDGKRWKPETPFDLPPSVETFVGTSPEFTEFLESRNLEQMTRQKSQSWTVSVCPIRRTYRDHNNLQDEWLQKVDRELFQCDPLPARVYRKDRFVGTVEDFPNEANEPQTSNGKPSESGHTSPHRRYRIARIDERGTVVPVTSSLPQSEALELMDRWDHSGAVLLPAE